MRANLTFSFGLSDGVAGLQLGGWDGMAWDEPGPCRACSEVAYFALPGRGVLGAAAPEAQSVLFA